MQNFECDDDFYDETEFDAFLDEKEQAKFLLKEIGIESIEDFRKQSEDLAKFYIKTFFIGKKSFTGEEITDLDLVFEMHKIQCVLNTSIISAVKRAYQKLDSELIITKEEMNEAKRNGDVTKEIKLVNETLKNLSKFNIPQQIAGGMMLLSLELFEGIKIET